MSDMEATAFWKSSAPEDQETELQKNSLGDAISSGSLQFSRIRGREGNAKKPTASTLKTSGRMGQCRDVILENFQQFTVNGLKHFEVERGLVSDLR